MIVEGWPSTFKEIPGPIRPYWCYRDELSVEDAGLILKGERVIIPQEMQHEVLQKIHAGHQGATKCKLRARSCVFWDGINKDIDQAVKSCPTCQSHQDSQAKETLMPHEIPTRPWQIVGTDLFHDDNNEFLTVADYYSKFPVIRELPKPCTSIAAITATKSIFAEHGVPDKIINDNGRHFDSKDYRKFAEEWCFDHTTSSPHYPQSNAFIERSIRTVKGTLIKSKEDHMDPYMALLCLRTTPIDNYLPSPGELLSGRRFKSNLPCKMHNNKYDGDNIQDNLKMRQDR
ncbi:uncharacterized protein K02A2.6-like [Haliotis rufescens]|uniref:uncharacterized protein K02A2.6-like n=1 Tax=Haliotis rufescens TaxID=6454 RepID=UPI001EB0A35B|nr:uncharacterized protein K02A2.6-like [Haliotis rufescens]